MESATDSIPSITGLVTALLRYIIIEKHSKRIGPSEIVNPNL